VDRDGQVVFFNPKGEALLGAPPAPKRREWDERPEAETAETLAPYAGAAAYTRDRHIPWALEAAAWEALEEGADSG
jgi:hypothetical protein